MGLSFFKGPFLGSFSLGRSVLKVPENRKAHFLEPAKVCKFLILTEYTSLPKYRSIFLSFTLFRGDRKTELFFVRVVLYIA